MQITQINRSDAESIKIVVKNVDGGGSLSVGMGVALVETGASIDGVGAVKATATNVKGFCGIAAQNIPINGYGLVTAWGYAASVLISNVGTSITITRGDVLKAGAVAGTSFSGVANEALSAQLYRYVYAADTQTISAAAYVQGIVRAL